MSLYSSILSRPIAVSPMLISKKTIGRDMSCELVKSRLFPCRLLACLTELPAATIFCLKQGMAFGHEGSSARTAITYARPVAQYRVRSALVTSAFMATYPPPPACILLTRFNLYFRILE